MCLWIHTTVTHNTPQRENINTPHAHRNNRSDPHPPSPISSIAEQEEVGDAKQENESDNGIVVKVGRSYEVTVKRTNEETGKADEWQFDCKVIGGRVIKGMNGSYDIRGIVSQKRIKFEMREKQGNYIEIYEGTAISINNNTTNSLVTFNGTYKVISGGSGSGLFEVTLPLRALQPQKPTTELRVTPLSSSSSSSSFSFLSFIDRNGDITGFGGGGGDVQREFVVDGRIDMWTNEITINKTVVGEEEGKWEGEGRITKEGESGQWKGIINEVGDGSEAYELTLPVEVVEGLRENTNEMESRWMVWMMGRVPGGYEECHMKFVYLFDTVILCVFHLPLKTTFIFALSWERKQVVRGWWCAMAVTITTTASMIHEM